MNGAWTGPLTIAFLATDISYITSGSLRPAGDCRFLSLPLASSPSFHYCLNSPRIASRLHWYCVCIPYLRTTRHLLLEFFNLSQPVHADFLNHGTEPISKTHLVSEIDSPTSALALRSKPILSRILEWSRCGASQLHREKSKGPIITRMSLRPHRFRTTYTNDYLPTRK